MEAEQSRRVRMDVCFWQQVLLENQMEEPYGTESRSP